MSHPLLVFAGFAIFYTFVVFWFPLGEDLPTLWSVRNTVTVRSLLSIHLLFLCVFLSVIWIFSWREHSFTWLARGTNLRNPAALQVFFLGAFIGIIERLWLSRGHATDNTGSADGSTEEASERTGIRKGLE
jgi:hypothetical protein